MSSLNDAVLDAALAKVATCTRVSICSSAPANFAGISAVSGGSYTLTAGDGNGDWTIANGDTSGRKVTMGAQTGTNASASIAGTHLAFDDGSTLLVVLDLSSTVNTNSGQEFQLSAVDVLELPDATNEA